MQAFRRSARLVNASRCMSSVSSDTSGSLGYQRPLAPGVLPAYDLAVDLLQKDSASKKELLGKEADPRKQAKLEIQSTVNLPEVRWAFAQGKYDLSQPIHRHLLEQKWRKQGALDLLMERVHQMKVIPDLLPVFHPSVDLQLRFSQGESVVPGSFLPVETTFQAPTISAQTYHPEEKLYTLLIVDPDVPDPSIRGFSTFLHALQPNVPLSATNTQVNLPTAPATSETGLAYIPPHPQRGTPYHRYTTILLPQSSEISIDVANISRENFDLRAFFEQHGFANGGGIHMFREEWEKSVGAVYKNVLGKPEPRFGREPRPDTYSDEKGQKFPKYTVV
ncbi:PEBP-like protein [Ceratobasidium sp. AG-I]|nr:PEBP-like protein [Ceratobasidium sp. AG-I]